MATHINILPRSGVAASAFQPGSGGFIMGSGREQHEDGAMKTVIEVAHLRKTYGSTMASEE
ncbi:MAG: hypothetical protein AAB270_02495 [Chloroflexota bacterium]|mgnify:CR=1